MNENCEGIVCCETSPFDGQCCQPTPFDYHAPIYRNTEQCYTATCPAGQVGAPKTVCVPEGSYTSTVSQAAVDAAALAAATAAANAELVCTCGGLEAPTISPASGAVILPVTVTLSHANPAAEIYYSINSLSGPFVLYTGPFIVSILVGGQPAVTAYARLTGCDGAQAVANYNADNSCHAYSVDQQVTLDTVCGDGFVEECGGYANWSYRFASGPYSHENLLSTFNLYDYFPYVQMWDGVCPLACRETPRVHTSGGLIIGPYSVDVEIFAITQLFVDDVYTFDGDAVPACSCSISQLCPSAVMKTLAAGLTTELKVWDTFGAHSWAVGVIGVREAGTTSACAANASDSCGCGSSTNTGSIESLMRAVQERYRVAQNLPINSGGGLFITWPNNDAAAAPGNYPVNNFYVADTNAHRVQHVKDVVAAIDDVLALNAYTPAKSLEGIQYQTVIPFYNSTTLELPEAASITTVAGGLSVLRPCVCRLVQIVLDLSASQTMNLMNVEPVAGGDCGIITSSLCDEWDSASPTPTPGTLPFLVISIYPTNGLARVFYGALTKNLTNYGAGAVTAYCALGDINVPPDGYFAYAPHSNTDGLLHAFDTDVSGGVYTTPVYGYPQTSPLINLPIVGGCPSYYGWEMVAFQLVIFKSSVPSDAKWTYYP